MVFKLAGLGNRKEPRPCAFLSVERVGAGLEGADDLALRLRIERFEETPQGEVSDFKRDAEIYPATRITLRDNAPVVDQDFERSCTDALGMDPEFCGRESNARGEGFADELKSEDQISVEAVVLNVANARLLRPRQEVGVSGDVGDEVVDFCRAKRQLAKFGDFWHRRGG